MRGDPERSDLNKDGRITRDELVKRFSSFSRDNNNDEGDRGSRGDERRERTERRSRDGDESESRTTYRFTSALERLPSEARSWIERYDDNKDGQVAMAEFTSSWTDSKVREFFEVDLNRDGVVTAAEYLESKER
jgi:Ca2+-binding EF-hand superfamily protein